MPSGRKFLSAPQQFSLTMHDSVAYSSLTLLDNGNQGEFEIQNGSSRPYTLVENHACVS